MEKRQHSISKLLRMTPEEAKLLEEKAKKAGMTESQYLRLMISQKPNDYPEVRQLLRDLINEVNRIGVNINQITHNHNAELYSNFIIGMLYTQIFQELYYQADFNCGGRLPIHVTFMLDEFANVALPDDYCSLLSTMRSREISSIIRKY